MKIHHLSCGSMCPVGRSLVNGDGSLFERGSLCCHVLLIESDAGLVLVDTGFGRADMDTPSRLPRLFRAQAGLQRNQADTAIAQIHELGLNPDDVQHILLTHLDLDHAGGLSDFPNATVHLHQREHDAAISRQSFIERQRYLRSQFRHNVNWQCHDPVGEAWEGFAAARAIPTLGDDILLIPLHGHTHGHSGIAVNTDKGWLLHCGDAYFHHGELDDPAHGPAGILTYERIIAMDNIQRLTNQARLRQLRNNSDITLFCSHDPAELSRCQGDGL